MTSDEFNEILWGYYAKSSRADLPWRQAEQNNSFDPYKILVSEIMLQQTQVARVVPKYQQWLEHFPNVQTLSSAPLADVLKQWSGLGYNRRAKFLHQIAKEVVRLGTFPSTRPELIKLPGVGVNTAGAILAYAYNQPAVFIETNIRTAFLYHYFEGQDEISDTELIPLIGEALDCEHPREWYWALMDYGSYLKQTKGNYSKNSKHHTKQSVFEGSKRQIRGQVLKILIDCGSCSLQELNTKITDTRLSAVLNDLQSEGLIAIKKGSIRLAQ